MEALIGFVAGYLVGSREGKAGVERLRESWNAIVTSPEVRRMAAEAVSVGEVVVRRASSRGIGQIGGTVVRTVASRAGAGGQREMSRAA
jgi:hypothetical protein